MQTSDSDEAEFSLSLDDFKASFEERLRPNEPEPAAVPEKEDEPEPVEAKADDEQEAEQEQEEQQTEADGEGEAEDEPAAEAADEKAETEEKDEDDKPDEDLTKELSHLPKDVRDQFSDLEPKAQRLVLDRYKHLEGRADKKFKEASELRKTADEEIRVARQFDDALKPYQSHLAEAGLNPAQAVAQALAFRDGLVKDPIEGIVKIADVFLSGRGDIVGSPRAQTLIRQLAQRAKVDLEGLDDDDAPSYQPSPQAELITHLQDKIHQLEEQFTTSRQAVENQQAMTVKQHWETFVGDEENFPHAQRLTKDIVDFADSPQGREILDVSKRLQWAYDRAVRLDPDAQAEVMGRERERLREEMKAEFDKLQKERSSAVRKVSTSKAKAASSTPKPAAPVARIEAEDENVPWDQAFAAERDKLFGGAGSRV